jgi:hypothetical protein
MDDFDIEDMMKIAPPPELNRVKEMAQRAIFPIKPADTESKAEKDFLFSAQRTNAGRALPPYYLTYFLLVDLLGFRNLGRFEKLAWSVPIDFEGTAYLIEHRKFGVGVFAHDAEGEEQSAKRIVELIKKGVRVAQPFFRWMADNAVRKSNFNVINNGSKLYQRYKCLRVLYEEALAEEETRKREHETQRKQREFSIRLHSVRSGQGVSPSDLVGMFTFPWARISEKASWLALAAIDAFFGWTEHIFIHLAILQGHITTGAEVADLAGADWNAKFKRALNISDPEMKTHFDELIIIRRQLRNFMAHGAFGKGGEAFHFHSNVGAVPVAFDYTSSKPKFSLSPELEFDDAIAIATIENFITHLWSGPREAAKIYIQESEVPLILPMARNGTYAAAMASVDEMHELVDHLSAEFDRATDMDW